ncbi:MAG: DUF6463 family protein [Betaproteobacteria bacterium]
MSPILPWTLFALGVGHVLYGCVKFRAPLKAAVASGFVGKFSTPEVRRTAFWFVMFGPMLMLAGQVVIHAAAIGDTHLVRLVGAYGFGVSVVGVCAFPKSPFLASLAISAMLLALGFGYL